MGAIQHQAAPEKEVEQTFCRMMQSLWHLSHRVTAIRNDSIYSNSFVRVDILTH